MSIGLSCPAFVMVKSASSILFSSGLLSWRAIELCKKLFSVCWDNCVISVVSLLYVASYCWLAYILLLHPRVLGNFAHFFLCQDVLLSPSGPPFLIFSCLLKMPSTSFYLVSSFTEFPFFLFFLPPLLKQFSFLLIFWYIPSWLQFPLPPSSQSLLPPPLLSSFIFPFISPQKRADLPETSTNYGIMSYVIRLGTCSH